MNRPRAVTILTHQTPEETSSGLRLVIDELVRAGVEVRLTPDEVKKHGIEQARAWCSAPRRRRTTDLVVVLGGDGTMLYAMRLFAGRRVPVFAFNFGAIGFLATVERNELDEGIRRVIEGDFDVVDMPALAIEVNGSLHFALNDVSFHRRADNRVAELAYSVEGDELGQVRCDGLVVSTPSAPRATTSPTAAPSWPGEWRASSSRSSPRTRSRRARSSSPPRPSCACTTAPRAIRST